MKVYLLQTLQQLPRQSGIPFTPRFLAFTDTELFRQDNGDGTWNFSVPNIDNKFGVETKEQFKCTILSTINNVLDSSTTELVAIKTVKIAPTNQVSANPLPVIIGASAVIGMEGNGTSSTTGQTFVYVKSTNRLGDLEITSFLVNTPIATLITTVFPSISTVVGLTQNRTASAINATATATAAQTATGYITSTSAAATSITLPTATLLATQLGATAGSSFDLIVDNTAGANTVTMVAGSGMTAQSAVTGGTTLTVASGHIGVFKFVFSSPTAAVVGRTV